MQLLGAFLIPYLIMLTIAGRPMYFMELDFGQFGGRGILSIWSCAPIIRGIGFAMVGLGSVVTIYYNVLMAYSLHYIGQSFRSNLPWTVCDPSWLECVIRNESSIAANGTLASQLHWERSVLDISSGLTDVGGLKWDLVLCLAISWLIVIACLAKGIKTSGKVIYFAATFPYLILITLMIVGLTQPGAWKGVLYLITPDFSKLFTIQIWREAASQSFFSLGVAEGGLITYASYNKFKHNIYK